MFIEALFTIAKICKQPRCPSADDWIQKMWDRNPCALLVGLQIGAAPMEDIMEVPRKI